MAVRTVSVRLQAEVSSYIAGMKNAQRATKDLAAEALRSTDRNHANLQRVGRAGLIAGGAVAAGLGIAVKAAADFDKALSGVRAVANGTAKEMTALRAAAIEAGQATAFSASDAAQAEAELAKAGVSVSDILGGALRGSLDLAAAGQLELADAATIAAQAMNIFKLEGSEVTHIADVLAAGANKSAADVGQLGDALRQGGLLAAQTGLGLEDTVAALSAFADNALVGSDAGTSLKTMLQRLVPQGAKAQSAMDAIGFSAYDAQGGFVGLESVADQLQKGLGTLSAQERASTLSIIFGSDAVRAANVLYEQGAAGVRDYTEAVDDNGAASRMAAVQMDNLAGDIEQLKGSLETALIQTGSGANGALRSLAKSATGAVNAFSSLPAPVQGAATGIAALASGALLTIGAVATLVPKVRQGREALRGLGAAGTAADAGMGRAARGAAKAAGIITVAVVAYEAAHAAFGAGQGELAAFTAEIEASAGDGTRAQIAALTDEMVRLKRESNEGWLNGEILGYGVRLSSGAYKAGEQVFALEDRIKELRAEQKVADAQTKNSATAQRDLADAYKNQMIPAAEDATDALEDYVSALENTVEIDAFTAVAELRKSFKDLKDELSGGATASAQEIQIAQLRLQSAQEAARKDGATASERATLLAAQAKLDDLRSSGGKDGKVTNEDKIALGGFAREVRSTAQAILDQSGSQAKANKAMREGREQFVELAEAAGYGEKKARALANELLRIPTRTDVGIDTSDIDRATQKIQRLAERLRAMNGTDVAVTVGAYNRARASGFAEGGGVTGPGTGTSDSIPAWLSNGEHVWTAREVAAVGGQGAMYAMRQSALSGALRFADGGAVSARRIPYGGSSTTASRTISMSNTIIAPDPVAAGQSVSRQVQNDLWAAGML